MEDETNPYEPNASHGVFNEPPKKLSGFFRGVRNGFFWSRRESDTTLGALKTEQFDHFGVKNARLGQRAIEAVGDKCHIPDPTKTPPFPTEY